MRSIGSGSRLLQRLFTCSDSQIETSATTFDISQAIPANTQAKGDLAKAQGQLSQANAQLTQAQASLTQAEANQGNTLDLEKAVEACAIAKDAAPYIHPRLSSVEASVGITNHEAALDELE